MQKTEQIITERIRVIRRLEFTKEARIDVSYDEHASILRAIIERRAPLARDLLHAHIRVSRDEVKTITVQMLQQARARARACSVR